MLVFFTSLYSQQVQMGKQLVWNFPLPRTHTGVILGNGKQGLMIWGKENQLNITIARAGFWDHRGRKYYDIKTNYTQVKELLKKGNQGGLAEAFGIPVNGEDKSRRPKQIGGGRFELIFPEKYHLSKAILDAATGSISVVLNSNGNKSSYITIKQAVFNEISWLEFPKELENDISIKFIPSWDFVGSSLQKTGLEPPVNWEEKINSSIITGCTQVLPEDNDLAIGYSRIGNLLFLGTALSETPQADLCQLMKQFDAKKAEKTSRQWWAEYGETTPKLNLPDSVVQEMALLGLYKQACASPPQGIPCTLQGPFMEEYQLPPWSNDYHFNINIQMIYWPALASNRLEHFDPLWKMIEGWLPLLKRYGKTFFHNENAILFPHAVDDGGHIVSGFWSGTIDHATSAWVAQLAWLTYRYNMDELVLRKVAWPLMNGSFEGYWSMLEKRNKPDGSYEYFLPVSVSPEWKGRRMDAWGENSSFQLAAIHMITDILPKMASIIGEKIDERWAEVKQHTPMFTTEVLPETLEYPEIKSERIILWKGMDLIESHRHHSHMAGIYPFKTIDPLSTQYCKISENTLNHWLLMGNGQWTPWTLPWSSSLLLQFGYVDAAIANLHYLYAYGYNEGKATTGNLSAKGLAYKNGIDWNTQAENKEIMQLDASFGALNAILELLVQNKNDTIRVVHYIPKGWKEFSFSGVLAEGAFLIGAEIKNGVVSMITIKSKKGGLLQLAHNFGDRYRYMHKVCMGEIFKKNCFPGEHIQIERIESESKTE